MTGDQKDLLRSHAKLKGEWFGHTDLADAIEAALKDVEALERLSDRVSDALEWAVKPPPGYCERTSMEMSKILIPPRPEDPQ